MHGLDRESADEVRPPEQEPSGAVAGSRPAGPQLLLGAVAVCYAAAQFLLLTPDLGLGYDEAVYASQFSDNGNPAAFHASRGWGTPFLVAPAVMVTDSVEILRAYLTVVSALLLFGAFRVWLPVRPGYTVPTAAALFAGCWTTVLYGHEVMPNLYTALGAIALTGLVLCVALTDGPVRRTTLVMVTVVAAVLPLFRPSDAMVVSASVAGATAVLLFSARRRRTALIALAALIAGSAVGFGQWIMESVLKFGGLSGRLEAATKSFGTPQWLIEHHVRALDGPTACVAAQDGCGPVPVGGVVWLTGAALLVAAGILAAVRGGHRIAVIVPVAVGSCIAGAYLYYPGMIAPRYLLPAWGLWAIAAAEGVVRLAAVLRRRTRVVYAVGCVSLVMGGHLHLQHDYTVVNDRLLRPGRNGTEVLAKKFRELGFRRPCLVYGWKTVPLAHHLGCEPGGSFSGLPLPAVTPPSVLAKARAGYFVMVIYQGDADRNAADIAGWPEHQITRGGWYARIGDVKRDPA
jgi:hypothetical protein